MKLIWNAVGSAFHGPQGGYCAMCEPTFAGLYENGCVRMSGCHSDDSLGSELYWWAMAAEKTWAIPVHKAAGAPCRRWLCKRE